MKLAVSPIQIIPYFPNTFTTLCCSAAVRTCSWLRSCQRLRLSTTSIASWLNSILVCNLRQHGISPDTMRSVLVEQMTCVWAVSTSDSVCIFFHKLKRRPVEGRALCGDVCECCLGKWRQWYCRGYQLNVVNPGRISPAASRCRRAMWCCRIKVVINRRQSLESPNRLSRSTGCRQALSRIRYPVPVKWHHSALP